MAFRQFLSNCSIAVTVAIVVTAQLGCSKASSPELSSLSSISSGGGGTGGGGGGSGSKPVTATADTFKLEVTTPAYTSHTLHKSTSFSDKCEVTSGATGLARMITCIVEVDEMDLLFHAVSWKLTAGNDCEYVSYDPYYYYAAPSGAGRGTVIYNTDATGVVVVPDGFGVPYTDTSGKPLCRYDYSLTDSRAPNCCTGAYNLTVNDTVAGTSTVTPNVPWGGKAGNCLTGAGIFNGPLSSSGFPKRVYYNIPYVLDVGIEISHSYDSVINKTNFGFIPSAAFNASFLVDPVIFTQSVSSLSDYALPGVSTFFANHYTSSASWADTSWDPVGAPTGLSLGNPDYVYSCYDSAHEIISSINIKVREWNTKSQIGLGAAGNANVSGLDSVTGDLLDDFGKWDNISPDAFTPFGHTIDPLYPLGYPFFFSK